MPIVNPERTAKGDRFGKFITSEANNASAIRAGLRVVEADDLRVKAIVQDAKMEVLAQRDVILVGAGYVTHE